MDTILAALALLVPPLQPVIEKVGDLGMIGGAIGGAIMALLFFVYMSFFRS